MAKQNIFDDPDFHAGYATLRQNESGLNAALEQPAFRSLLPPLQGLRILDLGCGFGHFARHAASHGSKEVIGVDISQRMLEVAEQETDDPSIRYVHEAVEEFDLDAPGVDLVVSSLTLHYVGDFAPLVARVAHWLAEGGRFVFSVEHPMMTARKTSGWHVDESGRRHFWPVDSYREEGQRDSDWFVKGVLKYHRTVETYINTLIDGGFTICRVLEPEPTAEALAARPELDDDRRRPPFLLISSRLAR